MSSGQKFVLTPINKDIDVLPGYERKTLKKSPIDILATQISVDEAFDQTTKNKDIFNPSAEDVISNQSLETKWSRFRNFCMASFQTRASDFSHTDITILFSKRVRDRLAELAVTSDEAQKITQMQQNEEHIRETIKQKSVQIEKLHQEERYWDMIELISETCNLLLNTSSPQFYPAQFMLVIDLVDYFGRMVYKRVSSQVTTKGDFLKENKDTTQLLALNWSMILCRTRYLLPRLLLQTAFLPCVKFHPFKTLEEAITQITNAIGGLGSATSSVYVQSFLLYTIFTHFPETSCQMILPLFTNYVSFVRHLQEGAFKRQFKILDYTFPKYLETHLPALHFIISVMVSVGDVNFLKEALEAYFSLGNPSSFILGGFLDELPPKFVSKPSVYPVLLRIIDQCDDTVPHPELIRRLISTLSKAQSVEGTIELMNEIWNRMRTFTSVDDFITLAAPMTKFISKFCAPHYTNLFLKNVVQLLRRSYSARAASPTADSAPVQLSKTLAESVSICIQEAVDAGTNFAEVLSHVGSIVDLMDFLDEESLVAVSRHILADVGKKPFELTDPLSIRILLELSQILFQSLSVLSPIDVVKSINQTIEWFLYRVDFGMNVEAHLNFLLSARAAFPTSGHLLGVIARIAFRLCAAVCSKKVPQYDVIARSLLSFAFVTIPAVNDVASRAELYLGGANVALDCCVVCFAHSFYEEFYRSLELLPPDAHTFNLYMHAFSLLLIMPVNAKPNEDPFDTIRRTIQAAVRKEWNDDEGIRLALEGLMLVGHALRTEYVLRVNGVDSNDVLFAGHNDFRNSGMAFINALVPRFVGAIKMYAKKGVIAAKTKVPQFSLKAMAQLADVYRCDEVFGQLLMELYRMAKDGTNVKEALAATQAHLRNTIDKEPVGKAFLQKY